MGKTGCAMAGIAGLVALHGWNMYHAFQGGLQDGMFGAPGGHWRYVAHATLQHFTTEYSYYDALAQSGPLALTTFSDTLGAKLLDSRADTTFGLIVSLGLPFASYVIGYLASYSENMM